MGIGTKDSSKLARQAIDYSHLGYCEALVCFCASNECTLGYWLLTLAGALRVIQKSHVTVLVLSGGRDRRLRRGRGARGVARVPVAAGCGRARWRVLVRVREVVH